MTLQQPDAFDAGIARLRSLGLSTSQLSTREVTVFFGCHQGVIITIDQPSGPPLWNVFTPKSNARTAVDFLLTFP